MTETQRNPFKPCCPSPLWFSQPSPPLIVLVPSPFSYPFFTTTSDKPSCFQRRELHFLQAANNTSSRITILASKIFFEHPNFVVSEGRLVSSGSGSLVNEEKEGAHRCFYGQSEMEFGAAESKNGWVAQPQKLRVVKIINFGIDSATKDEGLQTSIGSTYSGDDMGTQKASTLLLETSDNGSSGSVSHSRLKNVMFNGPLFRSHIRNADINRNDFKPDQIQGKSSFILPERENIQFNESLEGKQHELCKQKLLELPGSRLNSTIETGSSNGENIFLSDDASDTYTRPIKNGDEATSTADLRESLSRIYDEVLVVENISAAKEIVKMLTTKHRNRIYACNTEVCKIDVKKDTPVDHGEVTCFSIYSGEGVDFGKGKSCIWVDVLDGGGRDIMIEFSPFFEDLSIKKVWHNYSFDSHVIDNYGLKISGFHADTMHLARLWDSSRGSEDGYSLESLTNDPGKKKVGIISGINQGKISFKTIFGKGKLKKDGSEGKFIVTTPVEELQRKERMLWICYSSLDSINTLKLFESLKKKLQAMEWILDGCAKGNMYNFYEEYWRPFGDLLVKMETEGMLINREALAEMEKDKFRQWASKMCHGALHMNVGSDSQLRHLFFGGMRNSKDDTQTLEEEKEYKVLNFDKVIGEGKKVATKFHKIRLHKIGNEIETHMFTASGWPSVGGDVLKDLAGKVTSEFKEDVDASQYGTAYKAFGEGNHGREACHAIAALYEVRSIDFGSSNLFSFIQNFQLELRILAHLSNCKSMLDAFKNGGDFHSRTTINMYPHIRTAVEKKEVLLEWYPQPCKSKPPQPLLKDVFASERRKAKMLNFSIAYGKTPQDWLKTGKLQLGKLDECKKEVSTKGYVKTLFGRARRFPSVASADIGAKRHIERAAINTPVQGSAADVVMCAMLEITKNARLKELGWRLLLQVHDEVILEGPTASAEEAKSIVVNCMSNPFDGKNILNVDLTADAKAAQNWYAAK
ncbi:hypothetical protein MKW98_014405 [Papaver atlanticum]|uniref:DNA-directed DNA polymerase family A palm domain-containing protein n=1 Tax=Papaver atlanticum TaxID=357466 RepID=A0AAD4SPF0_9MAGN|nr:hypothetical protein MKW98_014405 [Papaver atlanticum]